MDKKIDKLMETLTADNIDEMLIMLENAGYMMDYLDMPYTDGTYKTEQEKARNIVEAFMDVVMEVQEFEGELASYYKAHEDYILFGGFEKDYFSSWLESCSNYPMVCEIRDECDRIDKMIEMWGHAIEKGWIDVKEVK